MKIPFNKPPVAGSELAYIAEALGLEAVWGRLF